MLFTSPVYLLFLAFVASVYRIIPGSIKMSVLAVFSLLYILLIDAQTFLILLPYLFINYGIYSILVWQREDDNKTVRKIVLSIGIVGNILFLGFFKYFQFFLTVFGVKQMSAYPSMITLVGVSFFVFKTMSFLLDAYKNKIGSRSFIDFIAYILFFPQFLSGPIQRFNSFSDEVEQKSSVKNISRENDIQIGLTRLGIGLVKKMVIADRLSQYINPIFNHVSTHSGLPLIIAVYAYAFQIYFDFSGYTDIAIGSARLMGITSPENFNRPYALRSIREFWRRWHITLSEWFRDYLYFPLGGSRAGKLRTYINLLIVFTIVGFWHGANWTFIAWGIIEGLYQVLGLMLPIPGFASAPKYLSTIQRKMWNSVSTIIAFHLVVFAWIFFRANTVSDALYIITHLFVPSSNTVTATLPVKVAIVLSLAILMYENLPQVFARFDSSYIRILLSIFAMILLFLFGVYMSSDFLYFKF